MYFKIIAVISVILAFILAPLKIFSNLNSLSFVESSWFTILFLLLIISIFIFSKFLKLKENNLEVKRNIPLGIISLVISASFLLCVPSYYEATSLYDFEWQPVVMAILSILSFVSFLIMASVHFTGKNLFSKTSFFLFCPVFWFTFNLILFLSIQNENSDIYDITLTSFLSLFFLYYTQVYSTSSKKNILKLLVGYGIPCTIMAIIKCVTNLGYYFGNYSKSLDKVEIVTCFVEFSVAIYIGLLLFETFKQIFKNKSETI